MINAKYGVRFQVQGVRKIVSEVQKFVSTGILDKKAMLAAVMEAYPEKGEFITHALMNEPT